MTKRPISPLDVSGSLSNDWVGDCEVTVVDDVQTTTEALDAIEAIMRNWLDNLPDGILDKTTLVIDDEARPPVEPVDWAKTLKACIEEPKNTD
jgi:hypothetical protein